MCTDNPHQANLTANYDTGIQKGSVYAPYI